MAKKRVKARNVMKKAEDITHPARSKFVLVIRMLFFFVALTVLFSLFEGIANTATLQTLFRYLFILCLFVSVALGISFFVLLVLKFLRK